jgi:prolyl oligopeptidase
MRLLAACVGAAFSLALSLSALASADDPFLWLEDVGGARALKWVHAQNEQTLRALRADAQYAKDLAAAEAIVAAKDRIPYGTIAGSAVYNFWQDEQHQRGVWRRTALEDYEDSDPNWETVIDLDKLSAFDRKSWVWKGADCLPPAFVRCLVKLSPAGADEIVVREFDVAAKSFVTRGFEVGEAKTDIAWLDRDTVLVATNVGRASLTGAGEPRVVKIWHRGQPLRTADTIYEGNVSDLNITPVSTFDRTGLAEAFIVRERGSFESELVYVSSKRRVAPVAVPKSLAFKGMHRRQLIFQAANDWTVGTRTYAQGTLVSFSLDEYLAKGAVPGVIPLFIPDHRTAVTAVAIARDAVYLSVLDNVKGRVHEVTFNGREWFWRRLILPDHGGVEIVSANPADREVLIKYTSFLTPDRLYLTIRGKEPQRIKSLPERFDADDLTVAQFEAVSADGTRVPYFLVRDGDAPNDGSTPTLLYAYGGFQVPTTPWYWSTAGKLWLEKGGAYAVANVRGGGEFGPRWHQAATRERRQKNFDDLAAVARDMIKRGITSPRRMGMLGTAHGGLVATGTFVRNPTLFNAVSAQVPLTDMLRYKRLSADASWISEYGNPDDPRQRAIIARWSPYQNIRVGARYPRAFFLASTRDDRIHPAHARKMAAKLDALGHPYLYFETTDTNDAASTLHQRAEQLALTYTYFRQQLMGAALPPEPERISGIEPYAPRSN